MTRARRFYSWVESDARRYLVFLLRERGQSPAQSAHFVRTCANRRHQQENADDGEGVPTRTEADPPGRSHESFLRPAQLGRLKRVAALSTVSQVELDEADTDDAHADRRDEQLAKRLG